MQTLTPASSSYVNRTISEQFSSDATDMCYNTYHGIYRVLGRPQPAQWNVGDFAGSQVWGLDYVLVHSNWIDYYETIATNNCTAYIPQDMYISSCTQGQPSEWYTSHYLQWNIYTYGPVFSVWRGMGNNSIWWPIQYPGR